MWLLVSPFPFRCADAAVPLWCWTGGCNSVHLVLGYVSQITFSLKGKTWISASVLLASLTSLLHVMTVRPVALRPSRTTAAFSILPPSPGLAHSTSDHSSGSSAAVPPLPMCLLLAAVTPRVSPWITFADRDTSETVHLRLHSEYSVNKGCRAVTN